MRSSREIRCISESSERKDRGPYPCQFGRPPMDHGWLSVNPGARYAQMPEPVDLAFHDLSSTFVTRALIARGTEAQIAYTSPGTAWQTSARSSIQTNRSEIPSSARRPSE